MLRNLAATLRRYSTLDCGSPTSIAQPAAVNHKYLGNHRCSRQAHKCHRGISRRTWRVQGADALLDRSTYREVTRDGVHAACNGGALPPIGNLDHRPTSNRSAV